MQIPHGSRDLHEEALGLDLWQMEELERALSPPPHSFLAVQGPPGTGKTSVIAATACELATAGGRCSSRRLQTWPLITP